MSEREPGFYFVQHPAHDGWLAGMLDDEGRWMVVGYGKYLSEGSFEAIGPRIPSPDEPWQCVPKEPTGDQVDAGCQAIGDCERLGECHGDCDCSPAPKVYRAMLAAAPKPEDV
ncbi:MULTISPECIES: hypothetical protein [unclassified Halomonas]|uniref:hypothetical protein n=1 Tax=unclassified Halomonas TaxID=2609666 RepID=UPI0020768463|nr:MULTISPECIES: hypothetical protein [unclassified Halomonas]